MSLTLSYLPADAFHFTTPTDVPEFFPMPDPPRNKLMMYKVKCNDAGPLLTITRKHATSIPEGWTADDYYTEDDARKSREIDALALAPAPVMAWPMFPFRGYGYLQDQAATTEWADAETESDESDDEDEFEQACAAALANDDESDDESDDEDEFEQACAAALANDEAEEEAAFYNLCNEADHDDPPAPSIFADAHPLPLQPVSLAELFPVVVDHCTIAAAADFGDTYALGDVHPVAVYKFDDGKGRRLGAAQLRKEMATMRAAGDVVRTWDESAGGEVAAILYNGGVHYVSIRRSNGGKRVRAWLWCAFEHGNHWVQLDKKGWAWYLGRSEGRAELAK